MIFQLSYNKLKSYMKMIWVYIRLYLMFFARTILTTIGVEITFYVIGEFHLFLKSLYSNDVINFPPLEYVNLISFGVAVLLALQTTYVIDGKRGKVYDNEFGFDPDKFKD